MAQDRLAEDIKGCKDNRLIADAAKHDIKVVRLHYKDEDVWGQYIDKAIAEWKDPSPVYTPAYRM